VDARLPRRPDASPVTRFEIAGDEGLLEFDSREVTPFELRTTGGDDPPEDPLWGSLRPDPCERELAAFVRCVRSGESPAVTGTDGVEALRIALAAVESRKRGRPVAPREVSA
jgi:UDP-N-acetylglucosamine 3-dehydrogenase